LYFNNKKRLKISQFGTIYKNAGFSPGVVKKMTTGEKLDQILQLLENKANFKSKDCECSDDFEIAFRLFQE
tara:strand:- start:23 stop:235 length:213 start_codon:yes stop_codon:yes gene_type:complete